MVWLLLYVRYFFNSRSTESGTWFGYMIVSGDLFAEINDTMGKKSYSFLKE